jgi:hypothetical protein
MSENLHVSADSQEVLGLQAKGSDEAQRLIAISALGLCRALAKGAVSPAYACHRLFGPALLIRLDRLGARPELRHAIRLATELEDVSDLIPDKLTGSIAEIETALLMVLADLTPDSLAGDKWLMNTSEQ